MVRSGYGPRTVWHGCTLMAWSNNSQDSTWTTCCARGALYGPRTGISKVFDIVRGPCGTHKCAVRHPFGHVRQLTQPEFAKIPHGRRLWMHAARTAPYGHFMVCLRYLNAYGVRKRIMHALKLYEPRTERRNSYGAARGPYGAWECDVTGGLLGIITSSVM